ncbi:hypothetical protein CVT24_005539 [Panaeolus cyanescens]|uniref:Uncharacterized protein n=1 Tax=Panaeolus cyanescens TaxID=181874 RepID=A0A409VQF6_9AGAR|nr:hypothetical protein CVT24_005539 [Panaeolus cyanescens]
MATRIIYRSARPSDLAFLRNFVVDTFAKREPTSRYLKLGTAGFLPFYDEYVHPYVDLKTTVVAEEHRIEGKRVHSEIVSCLVNTPYDAVGDPSKLGRVLPLVNLIDALDKPFKEGVLKPQNIPESRVLHTLLGATKEGYEGKRLFWNAMSESLRLAMDGRWDMAVAECTAWGTRKVCRDAVGFKEGSIIQYKDFEVDGTKPFEHLEGEAVLLWKDLRKGVDEM